MRLGRRIHTNGQSNSDIRTALDDYGFDADRFAEGGAELDAFEELATKYQQLQGEERSAIDARNDFVKAFRRDAFDRDVERARLAFQHDDGAATGLQLVGLTNPGMPFSSWLGRSRRFYDILLNDETLFGGFARRKGTRAMLTDGLDSVNEAERLDQVYQGLNADREQTRRDRDEARTPVEAWIRDAQQTAIAAMKDRPDLLEQLGIDVPSTD